MHVTIHTFNDLQQFAPNKNIINDSLDLQYFSMFYSEKMLHDFSDHPI